MTDADPTSLRLTDSKYIKPGQVVMDGNIYTKPVFGNLVVDAPLSEQAKARQEELRQRNLATAEAKRQRKQQRNLRQATK